MSTSAIESVSRLANDPLAELASRLDFAKLLDQHARMLLLDTALPRLALVPERMVLREAISQPYELVLDALSTSRNFELKLLIGEQMSVRRLMPDGSYKPWHGYVTEAAQLGADGGLARYRLVMKPWLAFLGLRRDCYAFQDKTALQIVEEIFKDYPQANFELQVTEPLRTRSLSIQYRETDLAFVQRLLAEEGLSYHFRHLDANTEADSATQADQAGQARHVMVITDRTAARPALGELRFAGKHVTANLRGQQDAVTAFMAQRSVTPNAVALGSWDYKALSGTSVETASALALGELPRLEVYDGSGAYRYENAANAERAAALALAALELQAKRFEGQGSARHLMPGAEFTLIDHPLYRQSSGANTSAWNYDGAVTASRQRPDNAFVVLAVEHQASNNLGGQLGGGVAQLLGLGGVDHSPIERGTYQCHFHCAPAAAALVPAFIRKPTAPGLQTALVVGAPGEALTTDRDLRVKIQFAWQRGAQPLAGGLAHAGGAEDQGNATGDDKNLTWVRVALPSAGANWGSALLPRVGTEVAVQFMEGDIDRPLIVGQLYNGVDAPPFAAGVDSGVNHPGVISGLHSQALDGAGNSAGYNQWVVDDATGQLRMRLAASYTAAQVGLGHLIEQAPSSAQRGAWRGAGFEASTQGWATLRAAQGLLVSTTARPGTYGSAQSTQMDAAEAVAQLKAARDLGQRLGDAAASAGALGLKVHQAGQGAEKFVRAVDVQADGKHAGPVNGQQALKAGADGRALSDPVEAFAQPQVLLETPSSAALVTEAGLAAFAGQDTALVAQGDLHQAAGHTYAQVSGRTTSLYTHAGGVKAFAAHGPVSLRAHTDALQIWADKEVTVISVNDEIRISAQSRIELIGGQSSMLLDGGGITFTCPGKFEVKAAGHAFLGGGGQAAQLEALPVGVATEKPAFMELNLHDEWLMPIAGAAYTVVFEDGTTRQGKLDGNGHARLDGVPNKMARVYYGEDPRPPQARVELPVNTFKASATNNEEAIENIRRAEAEAEKFWAEQATSEQRDVLAELNDGPDDPQGENAWHFLDEAQQKALTTKLYGSDA